MLGHLSARLRALLPLLLLLLLLRGIEESAAQDEDSLEKCCDLGSSWADQKLRCERFTGPVAGVSEDEQPACLEAVDICCRRAFEEQGCEQGKTDAKAGRACDGVEDELKGTPLGNYRRDCCEACKLGILTGSSGKSCAFKKFRLGIPWDPAFMECCKDSKTTSTSSTSTMTSPSTSASTSSTADDTPTDIDDLDDFLEDLTSPMSTFNSDDLCQLMKGLLCSEICVPTPGSYYCKCHEGSVLQADGRSCVSNVTTTTTITTTTQATTTISSTAKPTTEVKSTSPSNATASTVLTTPPLTTIPSKKASTKSPKKATTSTPKPTTLSLKAKTKVAKWTTKPLSKLDKISSIAKSRTTRSLPSEDNELNQACPSGYRFNPKSQVCDDIDECTDGSHNCGGQKCYNLPGSFQCAKAQVPIIRRKTSTTPRIAVRNNLQNNCAVGSRYDVLRGGCADINECEELEDACSSYEECVNSPGSFACNCKTGFRRDELTQACVDINECQLENDCLASQRCDNTLGSYTCVRFLPCGTGYTLNAATEICEDDDECLMGTHDCSAGYHCRNTLGSYRCDRDKPGRTTPRRTTRPTFRTTATAYTTARTTTTTTARTTTPRPTTTSTPRTTTTIAPRTTRPTPRTTTTIVPRTARPTPRTTTTTPMPITTRKLPSTTTTQEIPTVGTLGTTAPKTKTNVAFRPRMNCPRGFEPGPVGQCIDIDECHRNLKMCGSQRCINTIGSFRCEPRIMCGIGYTPDPITGQCKDVNECSQGIHKCGPKQTCENTQGGYLCYCPHGYEIAPNHDCVDVDECTRVLPGNVCGSGGSCVNTPGSFRCDCKPGFHADASGICSDVDECQESSGVCQQKCFNTWGGHKCGCEFGYRLKPDNRSCEDVDECNEFKDKNLCIGICDNTPGSFVCRCPDGYRLADDARTCIDIDECTTGSACRGRDEICQNVRGGFRCNKINCPSGYIHDSQRKNRCVRESPFCPAHDQACFQRPAHYTFNYISIVSMYRIPVATGQVEVFTMRGAYNLPGANFVFSMSLIQARAPPHVQPATESCFALRRPFPNQAVLVITKSIQGPQDIELEFAMEIYGPSGAFAGSAVAKIFIIVTQYEF